MKKQLIIDQILQLPSNLSLNERITARADIYGMGFDETFPKQASKNQVGQYKHITRYPEPGACNIPWNKLGADGLAMAYDIY